jgi:hypothetical protein
MTDAARSQNPTPVPMGVAVYGLPRSGTTLISDLLTVPGHGLVISEPDMYKAWNANIARRVHALAGSVGIELPGGIRSRPTGKRLFRLCPRGAGAAPRRVRSLGH